MLRAYELKLEYNEDLSRLPELLRQRFGLDAGEPGFWRIQRESVDARDKGRILRVYNVDFSLTGGVGFGGGSKSEAPGKARMGGDTLAEDSEAFGAGTSASTGAGAPAATGAGAQAATVAEVQIATVAGTSAAIGSEAKEAALLAAFGRPRVLEPAETTSYVLQGGPPRPGALPPVVAGFGPCGIFAALALAKLGWRPVVLERGRSMEERVRDVEHFWETGLLDENSNVQFGEGGAGTFSDGKLTTRIKDPRIQVVLEEFVLAGADPAILYKQKPHIGTDRLRQVVVALRKRLESLGGQVRFESQVTGLEIADGKLQGVIVNGSERIETATLVLAIGHSARDTLRTLQSLGLPMEQKPFSMGVRIEHLQGAVTEAQYGRAAAAAGLLGPADYQLSCRIGEGRGVYTFCMCPGGQVVAAASQAGRLTTNGMSHSARDAANANSALLVEVRPTDFDSSDPLAGVAFQEKYETLAFQAGGGGYKAPAARLKDFMAGGEQKAETFAKSPLQPSYRPGVTWADLDRCLPDFVAAGIREGIPQLARKLKGFDCPEAILTGIESRSSSPVRILRDKDTLASAVAGIYPAGEGAGYAGGIISSAVDGIRVAERISQDGQEGC